MLCRQKLSQASDDALSVIIVDEDASVVVSNFTQVTVRAEFKEHVPKKRGPKIGSGRVINELRAREGETGNNAKTPSIDLSTSDNGDESPVSEQKFYPETIDSNRRAENYVFDQIRPSSPEYFHLIPTCIDLFMEHIYPIMPLIYMPTLRESITRPLEPSEKNLVYSLCALTSTHMSGKISVAHGPESWDAAARFFLNECISVRQSYDFVEDKSFSAISSSYFVSTAFFELNQNRKSWYYLREALTMGQDIGFHDENTYKDLSPEEALCRRRTFWLLYVTERSFAILRNKPLTLSKAPQFPTTLHDYEAPEIHSGFMHLINTYHLLDFAFVDTWNESLQAQTSIATYTALQARLNVAHPISMALTCIQKADILVTQQWLRLIVWQSSMRQGLLSSASADESMTFSYPFVIAHSLLAAIAPLPITAVDVHGMGIFEKIFEIANTMLDVIQACGPSIESSRYGVYQDPLCVFIRTLSSTPRSRKQYATLLLEKAAEKPELSRLSSGLLGSSLNLKNLSLEGQEIIGSNDGVIAGSSAESSGNIQWQNRVVVEIHDDDEQKSSGEINLPVEEAQNQSSALTGTHHTAWIPDLEEEHLETFNCKTEVL
ncbi:putative sucrose utilization protein SUC1 [Golovinomyces cichoracearum]|uniref:Putative sucrose utilization protein SUC1 n=1 Tax=Golovinomyces cichoracearum TaxID=62708 RepID=A0A420IWL7_9PEZI|nr:putative sucrose utilization protein SUC1 [Golovinomyces cichoracearum]